MRKIPELSVTSFSFEGCIVDSQGELERPVSALRHTSSWSGDRFVVQKSLLLLLSA
jgi:hypothetical protein